MQMYRVKFARKLAGDIVDLGDVLVVASSREAAAVSVCEILKIPPSEIEMEVSRVKPSFYQISRQQVKHSLSTSDASAIDAINASSATFPGVTENMPDTVWFSVEARANIRAENENHAISKLAKAISVEIAGGEKQKGCKELDIVCDRTELHPRSPAVGQNALYSVLEFFQGGDGRT